MPKIPVLIAKRPILHLAKLYRAGDELPTFDPVMLQAWLDAGSAEWQKDPEEVAEELPAEEQEAPADEQPEITVTEEKADPQTAEPGLPGDSGSGDPDELVGKIPKTPERRSRKGAK